MTMNDTLLTVARTGGKLVLEEASVTQISGEMVSLGEAAKMIRASVRTVYRLIDDGELPQPIKIRARSFLPRCAVVAYLVRQGFPESNMVLS